MPRWTVNGAVVREETPTRLVISPGSDARGMRRALVGVLLIVGVTGMVLGVVGGDTSLTEMTGTLFVLPGLVLLFLVPTSGQVVIDLEARTVILTREHLLGTALWPRKRETTVSLSPTARAEYKVNWLGSRHRVEMSPAPDHTLILRFGRAQFDPSGQAEPEAKRAALMLQQLLSAAGPRIRAREHAETLAASAAWWRPLLAGTYGLATAVALGELWHLMTIRAGVRFGLEALVLGLLVGVVVTLMSGGSRDVRYAVLAAVLSLLGIAYGELRLSDLSVARLVDQFEFIVLLIWSAGALGGVEMVRHPLPPVRKLGCAIREQTWFPVWALGIAALVSLVGFSPVLRRPPFLLGMAVPLLVVGLWAATERRRSRPLPEASAHYDQAGALAKQGRYEEAIVAYGDAIRLRPGIARAHNDLGTAHLRLGQLGEAEAAYKEAIRCDPALAAAHANLANIYCRQYRYAEGIVAVEEALRLDPSLPQAYLTLGQLFAGRRDRGSAQGAFERAIELDGDMPEAHIHLGILHAEQGNWGPAIDHLSRALAKELAPEKRAEVHVFRGLAHWFEGNREAALADLEEALRVHPGYAFAHLVRGSIRADLGQGAAATLDLERALALGIDPGSRRVAEGLLRRMRPQSQAAGD